ncbi:hypothetical protein [Pseudomonas multiresinivorans]|uniref:Uncharacterized protein n=1 Tax=Pseudomonas multiresinivorans TaxID=95301 RepID=A0A7Z3BMH2_9PSED|nr:hypothetical protein [Pseudomonas multiresinivorans]QJP09052.1 hypothetical protein G4G71_14640 [Pseudomonas multiresinivorans]
MFTDKDLAQAMLALMVSSGLINQDELELLRQGSTENDVRETLGAIRMNRAFARYWAALGVWMQANGGDQGSTSGTQVPGRDKSLKLDLSAKSLYEDTFGGVNRYISSATFSPIKAISNHMRFVNFYLHEEDSESDSGD